jgi:hypothetical protein
MTDVSKKNRALDFVDSIFRLYIINILGASG